LSPPRGWDIFEYKCNGLIDFYFIDEFLYANFKFLEDAGPEEIDKFESDLKKVSVRIGKFGFKTNIQKGKRWPLYPILWKPMVLNWTVEILKMN
jgi:hypothetical protein